MAEKSARKTLLDVKELLGSSLRNSDWLQGVSKQWTGYEKRLKSVVQDLDLKSRDARDKSRKQLDAFAHQLQKTRVDVEKKVTHLINYEAGRINQGFNELVTYLKSLSLNEKLAKPVSKKSSKSRSASGSKSKSGTGTSTKSKKTTGRSKVVAGRKAAERSSLSQTSTAPISH